jgi:hypothetical protein
MYWVYGILDWLSERYAVWFADWLHIHFVIRTAILLLALWGALFLTAQLMQYAIGPLWVLFYRHIVFRFYNYLFVETLYELIYIRFYSKDKPTLRGFYLRLSDRVKKNRLILAHTRYKGILYHGGVKRGSWRLVAVVGVVATLWLTAFGLHQEYAVPALAGNANHPAVNNGEPSANGTNGVQQNPANPSNGNPLPPSNIVFPPSDDPPPDIIYPPGYVNPALWPDAVTVLRLNEHGTDGARLRDRPGFGGVVIEMLWGARQLEYLDSFTPDEYVSGLYWLRVRSPEGLEGYIASHLVELE